MACLQPVSVLAVQLWQIFPYTKLAPIQLKAAEPGHENRCVTLLVSNVLTPNRNAQGLITQILEHQPDIVLTLETDDWWSRRY
jgi:endonuclease/exonuclease/phosphatase (EEP) superfamily protein YafD